MYVFVCMLVDAHVWGACACEYECMWRPEIDAGNHPGLPSPLFSEAGSLSVTPRAL